MAAKTEQFQTSGSNLGSTIAQSLNMIAGKDVPSYTLVFIDPTTSNAAGSQQSFYMPNIVIGRGGKCNVRYGDNYSTVSREHASITSGNGQFYLNHNPSAKNPTIVNGQAITGPRALVNGDEMQFSADGPRLRFNTATTKKSSTLGLTSRIGSAVGQAVKPYKTGLRILGFLLLGAIGLAGYSFYKAGEANDRAQTAEVSANTAQMAADKANSQLNIEMQKTEKLKLDLDNAKATGSSRAAALKKQLEGQEAKLTQSRQDAQHALQELKKIQGGKPTGKVNSVSSSGSSTNSNSSTGSASGPVNFENLPSNDVYYIYATEVSVSWEGKTYQQESLTRRGGVFSGTGFLTTDNKLVTARHIIQPYRYGALNYSRVSDGYSVKDGDQLEINAIEANGGKVIVTFKAESINGDVFTFNTKNAVYDDSSDKTVQVDEGFISALNWQGYYSNDEKKRENRFLGKILRIASNHSSDWAYIPIANRTGTTKYNRSRSKSLKMGEELFPLGYTYGESTQQGNLKPLLTKTMVAQDNLTNGIINTSIVGFGQGNSGGPVFVRTDDGGFEAVGIVSAGLGTAIGVVCPVSALR